MSDQTRGKGRDAEWLDGRTVESDGGPGKKLEMTITITIVTTS